MADNGFPVEVKVLDARVFDWGIPRYQSEMAAGIDLFACVDDAIEIESQAPAQLISSGIAVHIGVPDAAAMIVPRSGRGHREGLVLGNTVGILDADYTGPLMISVWNRNAPGAPPIVIRPGDRITQLIFVPILRPELRAVVEFSNASTRGAGGFGSTGHAAASV